MRIVLFYLYLKKRKENRVPILLLSLAERSLNVQKRSPSQTKTKFEASDNGRAIWWFLQYMCVEPRPISQLPFVPLPRRRRSSRTYELLLHRQGYMCDV